MSAKHIDGTVLGLNSSTQSVSAIVIEPASGKVVWGGRIRYDDPRLLEIYGVPRGFVGTGDGVVLAPALLWVHALDLLLTQLSKDLGALEMRRIKRISGAGQQHGTFYLTADAPAMLHALSTGDPLKGPAEYLRAGFFRRLLTPIWMDSSTGIWCERLAAWMGGALEVARRTGSIPVERFSGIQMLKYAAEEREAYHATAHIGLVSSLMCSLFIGAIAPIDYGDGAGMNMMNIESREWDSAVLAQMEREAGGLRRKLPKLAPTLSLAGKVCGYMVRRFGFSEDAMVLPFSGDNVHSLVGTGVYSRDTGPKIAVASLGTSDTLFAMTDQMFDPAGSANVFAAAPGGNMILVCFKNGSLAREAVRDKYFPGDNGWSAFNHALATTAPGNGGAFMLPYFLPEITPNTRGRPLVQLHGLDDTDPGAMARGICEAQFINMALQRERLIDRPDEIRVTGGASVNEAILQIAADCLNVPLVLMEAPGSTGTTTDSVSLGAALCGAATMGHDLGELTHTFCVPKGNYILPKNAAAYGDLKESFARAVSKALQ